MQAKIDYHSFTGMQQDITLSKHPANALRDARNIRLTQREGSTLLAITNEKGTVWTQNEFNGNYLGHCLLGDKLVVFSKHTASEKIKNDVTYDYIELVHLTSDKMTIPAPRSITTLFKGNLNFNMDYPIEAIASYENEKVQKIYWTDGFNQPRVINLEASPVDQTTELYWEDTPYTGYDFVRTLQLNETVTVKKLLGASGIFPAGVLQYAFTYYTKHGQESAVFYTTPLIYTSYKERGGSPEDSVENAFSITVDNVDRNFDFLRIYSIMRTSINGTPLCKRVQDIEITADTLSFTDTGREGDTVDPTELLYKGGEKIACGTIEQKDGTLFLGDLKLKRESLRSWVIPEGGLTSEEPVAEVAPRDGETSQVRDIKHPIAIEDVDDPISVGGTSAGGSSGGSGGGNTTESSTGYGSESSGGGQQQSQTTKYGGDINNDLAERDTFEMMVHKTTEIVNATREFTSPNVFKGSYEYSNQLTAYADNTCVPPAGFKRGDTYRCGVQFQHETGVWSDPVWIADVPVTNFPYVDSNDHTKFIVPTLDAKLKKETAEWLMSAGYIKARAVVVFPEAQDRNIVCQGVCNPVLKYNSSNAFNYIMSSWFFRFYGASSLVDSNGFVTPQYEQGPLTYTNGLVNPGNLRKVEIQGRYNTSGNDLNFISVDWAALTMHSPDVAFEEQYMLSDFSNYKLRKAGDVVVSKTLSDIDIQTETPTIKDIGSGFIHKSGVQNNAYGINAGLFYEDFLVDDTSDDNGVVYKPVGMYYPVDFLVYPWQKAGSLNNDCNRPEGKGVTTAKLKQKIISNLRYSNTTFIDPAGSDISLTGGFEPQVFNSNQSELLKLGSNSDIFYKGNLDTMLIPDDREGSYFAFNSADFVTKDNPNTSFTTNITYRTFAGKDASDEDFSADVYAYENGAWGRKHTAQYGDKDESIGAQKGNVRIKYKSTPHVVFYNSLVENSLNQVIDRTQLSANSLPVMEFTQVPVNPFGGTSADAFKANIWLPCGEPVRLDSYGSNNYIAFSYSYGDTYYQRWDCLKTYAFAEDDINQIVEIGSFMLETHVNIDGRYDRNRGQVNNLYVSPRNFNLLNKVYSQRDNFFSYRILDNSYYKNSNFPNQVTWTKEKKAGADTDLWTNITLASTLDIDGSKGKITSINAWNSNLFCFQERGISVINFNSRVQIPVSDGVPIEITNGYKVDGYRYYNDSVGCSNKFSIKETPNGVYFIDSLKNDLYMISEGMTDLTEGLGMRKWFKEKMYGYGSLILRTVYDNVHNDIYCVANEESICFSEALKTFTSIMDYGDIKMIEAYNGDVYTLKDNRIYKMFGGLYNDFFGDAIFEAGMWVNRPNYKPWYFTFVSNGVADSLMTLDKIFTNIDYRLDFFDNSNNYVPEQTFDYLRVWDEYQTTNNITPENIRRGSYSWNSVEKLLQLKPNGLSMATPYTQGNPQKKFRQWRIQIPRAMKLKDNVWKHSNDRVRNPWCTVTLGKFEDNTYKATLQDLSVMYYI